MHCLLQVTHCELTVLFHPIHWPITVTYLLEKRVGGKIGEGREAGRRKGGEKRRKGRREEERGGEGRREWERRKRVTISGVIQFHAHIPILYTHTHTSSFSTIADSMTIAPQFLSYTIFQKSRQVVLIGPCVRINAFFCL